MDRRVLEIKQVVEAAGYQFVSYEHKRGGHAKVTVSDGNVTRFVICPVSSSDYRWKRNKPAELKRIFREYYETNPKESDARSGIVNHPDVDGASRQRKGDRRGTRSVR